MLRRQAVLEGVAVAVLAVGLLSSPGCTQWQAARLYQSGSQALQAGDVDRAIDELSAAARLVPQASETLDQTRARDHRHRGDRRA